MNDLQIFKNNEFGKIRTILIGDKPYVVAVDVAKNLGYKNTRDAIKRHCKGVVKHDIPTKGGMQKMNCIPEGDIYRLIANSELPGAERFESWVFDEVLPTIRKHGAYMTPEKIEEVLMDPDTIIQLATALKEERALNQKQRQIIGELKPKADYTDLILKNKGLVTITQITRKDGTPDIKMNTKWTQKGRLFLYELLKENNFLPTIEKTP